MALYIVPVPIGNLKDITLRALETLNSVDFIITEDTRISLKLLNHFGIKKKLYSYYKPKEAKKAEFLCKLLAEKDGAIISDSGTPLISDPGFILIKKLIKTGIKIISLPGPTALIPALTLSGMDISRFIFLGFPPRTGGKLVTFLKKCMKFEYTMIFYESPMRITKFIDTAYRILGDRDYVLVREMTKKFESVIRGRLSNFSDDVKNEKMVGEMVVLIEGTEEKYAQDRPSIECMEDIYNYFKENYSISKNEIKKKIIRKK